MKKFFDILAYVISIIAILAFVVFLHGYGSKKESRLHERVVEWRQQRQRHKEYLSRHEKLCDIGEAVQVVHAADTWYKKYHVIRHAGGGIDGKYYSNSLEVWNLSYERGNRVFDVDMAFTSDGHLVLRHYWGDNLEDDSLCAISQSEVKIDGNGQVRYYKPFHVMTLGEFMQTKLYRTYTPLTCEDMIAYMATHEDIYMSLDMKDDVLQSYDYVVKKAHDMDELNVLDRVIVSLYDVELYDEIAAIYPFKNWVLRQQYVHERNYSELLQDCIKYNIPVVNISYCYANDEGVQWLHNAGIYTYVAICDYMSDMEMYQSKGIWGCCSNNLNESNFLKYE